MITKDTKDRVYVANPDLALERTLIMPDRSTPAGTDRPWVDLAPKAGLYMFVFATWTMAVCWFQPRLWSLLDMAYNFPSWLALFAFILFINFAWLYGIYNVSVVLFSLYVRWFGKNEERTLAAQPMKGFPGVALLYTTCNDFVEDSVVSCVQQDYPNYQVYILDDSSQQEYKDRVDAFAARYPDLVTVVRRSDRKGFKAGNMNHGLSQVATSEPYFAIADADEILPTDFLAKLVPIMEADPHCGFVQANHRANPKAESSLSQALGVGIDIHWKWYQPLRNEYGFVMFLGHGALLRRKTWEEVGGFPDIVSEDLGFAIHAREKGYRGRFVEDVVCYEDFPDSVRAFRIRHMKWTRGTCEFLARKFNWLIKARNISWTEKLDILFPTLNLPLTLLYFLFMVNANIFLPSFFGHWQELTWVTAGREFTMPVLALDPGFGIIFSWDFFLITLLTFFGPVLCFILALAPKPRQLFRFLSHSTALYAALSPLSSLGVVAYFFSGEATFLVTGDKKQSGDQAASAKRPGFRAQLQQLVQKSHPDQRLVQGFEIGTGVFFGILCLLTFQISFFGLCLAFIMLPVMHHLGWESKLVRAMVYLPFVLILIGLGVAGMSMVGMQAVFFGYGFHF